MTSSNLQLFDALPLGARFRYPKSDRVWVKIENGGCGVIAAWDNPALNWPGQSICTLEESPELRARAKVEWLDQRESETGPAQPSEIERLRAERDDYRAAYNRVATAARAVTAELQKVGDETEWRDGDETDRVYPWYEMLPLVSALNADIHQSALQKASETSPRFTMAGEDISHWWKCSACHALMEPRAYPTVCPWCHTPRGAVEKDSREVPK